MTFISIVLLANRGFLGKCLSLEQLLRELSSDGPILNPEKLKSSSKAVLLVTNFISGNLY